MLEVLRSPSIFPKYNSGTIAKFPWKAYFSNWSALQYSFPKKKRVNDFAFFFFLKKYAIIRITGNGTIRRTWFKGLSLLNKIRILTKPIKAFLFEFEAYKTLIFAQMSLWIYENPSIVFYHSHNPTNPTKMLWH